MYNTADVLKGLEDEEKGSNKTKFDPWAMVEGRTDVLRDLKTKTRRRGANLIIGAH